MREYQEVTKEEFEIMVTAAIGEKKPLNIEGRSFGFREFNCLGDLLGIHFTCCTFKCGAEIFNLERANGISLIDSDVENSLKLGARDLELRSIDVGQIIIENNRGMQAENDDNAISLLFDGVKAEGVHIRKNKIRTFDLRKCFLVGKVFFQFDLNLDSSLFDFESISFSSCYFYSVSVKFQNCLVSNLTFRDCEDNLEADGKPSASKVWTNNSSINEVYVFDSDLSRVGFSFFQSFYNNILIYNSKIREMAFTSVSETKNCQMNRIKISGSELRDIYFVRLVFLRPFDLRGAIFSGYPSFLNCRIPQGSLLPASDNFRGRNPNQMAACYRALRLSMEEQRAREEEGMFFKLEQECYIADLPVVKKIFSVNFWYGILSEYGTNYRRPAFILVALWIFPSLLYSLIASPEIDARASIDWGLFFRSLAFSLEQIVSPFGAAAGLAPLFDKGGFNFMVFIVGFFQSLFSALMIVLSVLSLRWKFKRG